MIMIKSRYKHLVVSGCSFTTNEHVPDQSDWNWPNILAKDTNMIIHNLATAGAGNTHIANSIIVYLEKKQLPPEDVLVLAMWSGTGRIDFTVSNKLSPRKKYQHNYLYTPECRLHQGGNWWNIKNPADIDKILIDYSKFQDEFSLGLQTWLSMNNLASYLSNKGIQHFFTSFLHYKSNDTYRDAVHVDIDNTLSQMGLKIDYSKWLNLASADYFGDWCAKRGILASDGFHPGVDGPYQWTREILIPLLIELDILYNEQLDSCN